MSVEAHVRQWLAGPARRQPSIAALLAALGQTLVDAGVSLDRMSVVFAALHAVNATTQHIWVRGGDVRQVAFDRSDSSRLHYTTSPFYLVHKTKRPVHVRLLDDPPDRFGAQAELIAQGIVDYMAAPLPLSDGRPHFVSFGTRAVDGFSSETRALLERLVEPMAAAFELFAVRETMGDLLATYVGREPARRVLGGEIVRGQVRTVRAAILFSDLRGFTRQSMTTDADTLIGILNEYFDCLVPAIEAEGGDVLKFIGDGLLAIFPEGDAGMAEATARALTAARAACAALASVNASHEAWPDQAFGIGLHAGSAAYGNIGSGTRLDFTVIGRDVNLAARISGVCAETGDSILTSAAFVQACGCAAAPAGAHRLHGIEALVPLFRPA